MEGLQKILKDYPNVGAGQERVDLVTILKRLDIWNPRVLIDIIDGLNAKLAELHDKDRELIRQLLVDLNSAEQPKNLTEAVRREICYAKLKLINCAQKTLRVTLLVALKNNETLNEMFDKADGWAWQSLEEGATLEVATNDASACALIDFMVKVVDKNVANTYLFKHGSRYEWDISYIPTSPKDIKDAMKRVGADPAKIKVEGLKLNVTTEEPFVKQFIPVQATSVKAHVTIRYENNKPIELDLDESFGVEKANIFSAVAAFRRVELAALAIALIAAITTGMQSQQYQDAINGSLSTYWFLFAWGFATDQIKNVLEHIGTLSSTE